MTIYRGDDTNAFGTDLLSITLNGDLFGFVIDKAVFQCGSVSKEFSNPVFPLKVNLTSEETKRLSPTNIGYLLLYERTESGDLLRKTCSGYVNIVTEKQRVS